MDGKSALITLTPTLETSPYAASDRMGGVLTLANAMDADGDTGAILSIAVYDKAAQGAAFDILFFNTAPTLVSADNAALEISDADMAAYFLGRISVAASDYTTTVAGKDATLSGLGLLVKAAAGSDNLYAVLQCQGAPTYAASSLVIKVGIGQD
jgi:hypothetical protein